MQIATHEPTFVIRVTGRRSIFMSAMSTRTSSRAAALKFRVAVVVDDKDELKAGLVMYGASKLFGILAKCVLNGLTVNSNLESRVHT